MGNQTDATNWPEDIHNYYNREKLQNVSICHLHLVVALHQYLKIEAVLFGFKLSFSGHGSLFYPLGAENHCVLTYFMLFSHIPASVSYTHLTLPTMAVV